MPWHDVQYLKITCRAGPFGGVTCGRVALPPICADTADEPSTAPSATTIAAAAMPIGRIVTTSHHLQRLEPAGARPDPCLIDPVQVQHAQQHVRGALRVVGEYEVTVPLERAVDASDENHGHLLVRMAMRVAHVAALVDQHVIEQRAVAVRNVPELFTEVREVLDVVAVHLRVVGDVLRLVAVVRGPVPGAREP